MPFTTLTNILCKKLTILKKLGCLPTSACLTLLARRLLLQFINLLKLLWWDAQSHHLDIVLIFVPRNFNPLLKLENPLVICLEEFFALCFNFFDLSIRKRNLFWWIILLLPIFDCFTSGIHVKATSFFF